MAEGLNVLSLFDGISSGRLALERAGIPVANYFASEIDKYAIQVAQKNFPDGYTDGISKTQRYRCLGNAWTVDIISHILANINEVTTEQCGQVTV